MTVLPKSQPASDSSMMEPSLQVPTSRLLFFFFLFIILPEREDRAAVRAARPTPGHGHSQLPVSWMLSNSPLPTFFSGFHLRGWKC